MVKAESSGEDPRATGGLVSNLPHPRVNKTKQHRTIRWKLQIIQEGARTILCEPRWFNISYTSKKLYQRKCNSGIDVVTMTQFHTGTQRWSPFLPKKQRQKRKRSKHTHRFKDQVSWFIKSETELRWHTVETSWSNDGSKLKGDNMRRGSRLQDRVAM